MNPEDNFVDKTVLSTPEPKAFSTEHKRKAPRLLSNMYQDSRDSLQLEPTIDAALKSRSSEDSHNLNKLRREVAKTIVEKARLSSLPSRYLKSNATKASGESYFNVSSGSTISESDLLRTKTFHGETSTPRESMMSTSTAVDNPERQSLGRYISAISTKLLNQEIDLDTVTAEFKKMLHSNPIPEEDSNMFMPAEAAASKLAADELSWRREKDVPGKTSMCFSENASLPMKMSMGEFFKMKSDGISDLDIVTISPEKTEPPVPLINPDDSFVNSTMSVDGDMSITQDSLSLLKIVKVLEDSVQTPRKAVDYLFNNATKKNKNMAEELTVSEKCRAYLGEQSMTRSALPSQLSTAGEAVIQNKYLSRVLDNKENIEPRKTPSNENVAVTLEQCPISQSTNTSIVSGKSPNNPSQIDRSLTSVRSASSLSNLAGGKLPIDSSRTELVWGCVKPGKSVTQEVVLRNKSQSRLRFQCSLSGPSYKILKDHPDSEYVSIAKYVLQPGEIKRIFISFAPIQIGPAIDSVSFSPTDPTLNQYKSQKISLFGYGGFGNVEIGHVTKDTTGKFWLCLGDLGNKPSVSKSVVFQNTGTLPAFGLITFDSKDISSFSTVSVSSDKFVLLPQEQRKITITYTPTKRDLKMFQSLITTPLLDLGVMKLISGSEVTRARISRLCRVAAEKQLSIIQIAHKLSQHIPGEVFPDDVNLFKETNKGMSELLQEITIQEIVLTLEQDPEATLLAHFPEDTMSFQTLCQDASYCLENADKASFRLESSCVILTPPLKTEDMLLLCSEHCEAASYEVRCESSDLIISCKSGVIQPGVTLPIGIKCKDMCVNRNTVYDVVIVVNGCTMDATVKVLKIQR